MATNPTTSANLPCGQCEFLNEPERVYCHNCGAKLDRSLLPKTEEQKQESPEKARKRIAKMTNPKSGSALREIKTLINVLIYAVIVAAIYLLVQKPAGVPEVKRELAERLVSSDMMEAIESPAPRAVSFSEDEANQYLKQLMRSKDGAVAGMKFERAYVNFLPGALRIGSEQSLWGYSIFSGVLYRIEVPGGKFTPTIIGGNFGRLSIDPRAMHYAAAAFGKLFATLKRERLQMDRMQTVVLEKGRIDLVTKGAEK